jgi:C-terminal processing protease CtpA/Prc
MKRMWILSALVAMIATTASAGEGHECTAGTQECLDKMAAKMQNSGWVGVELEGIENAPGNLVAGVIEGSPAEAAGVKSGDVLLAINSVELTDANMEKLGEMWKSSAPGQKVVWTVQRDGAERQVNLVLGRMPADILARYVGKHMLEHAQVEVASTN